MTDCIACDLSEGRRSLPGGLIHHRGPWLVEHAVGPVDVGTLIVKPHRHVTFVADLTDEEAQELGPVLCQASRVGAVMTIPRAAPGRCR